MKRNKYGNKKVQYNGLTFDSARERDRWIELKILEGGGIISALSRQVEFELLPSQRIEGKVKERAVKYRADFVYQKNGKTIVEDSKGFKTPEYIIKRKLMLFIHHIEVIEV